MPAHIPHLSIGDLDDEVTAKYSRNDLYQPPAPTPMSRLSRTESGVSAVTEIAHRKQLPFRSKEFNRKPPPSGTRGATEQQRYCSLEVLRLVLDCYAMYAGPAARPIMLGVIRTLGTKPERFPWSSRGELLQGLTSRLDSPETRQRFWAQAARLLERAGPVV